ncbi:hypothetical protein [Hydrocarboniphaga effusa]|uniref:hypothetical protein n=1 Tax=Hydrocarboniphaga effusa TaxID=243629 RepID=UPI003BA8C258
MTWRKRYEVSCMLIAMLMSGTSIRGCIEVTEPVATHYVTADQTQPNRGAP